MNKPQFDPILAQATQETISRIIKIGSERIKACPGEEYSMASAMKDAIEKAHAGDLRAADYELVDLIRRSFEDRAVPSDD